MNIKTIKQSKISDEVVIQIKDQISSGHWTPGAKIPGELKLKDLFGVSRVSVRDAIQRMVGMGILVVRRGEGTFVSDILPKNYFNALLPILMVNGAGILEILEFRSMVEVESARLAAARASQEDLARLGEILEQMKKCKGSQSLFAEEDLNFHTALALASHNSVLVKVNTILHDMLKHTMREIVELTGYEGGILYHTKILEAVADKEEKLAADLMKEHIQITMSRVAELKGSNNR